MKEGRDWIAKGKGSKKERNREKIRDEEGVTDVKGR